MFTIYSLRKKNLYCPTQSTNHNQYRPTPKSRTSGFTIVELLIVVVVIAILATVTVVAYNSISSRAKAGAVQAEASQAGKKVQTYATTNNEQYPTSLTSAGVGGGSSYFEYSVNNSATPKTFCISATAFGISYNVSSSSSPTVGLCPGHTGIPIVNGNYMQTINASNCPTSRTRAVDARDNHTYWVQRLADDKCWMLTNLAYAGGGTNTYADVKPALSNGTSDSASTYTVAKYYIVPSSTSFTVEPTSPDTSTNGTGQYSYVYNWCAAMGAQTSTSACANASTPAPNVNISLCPAGWSLPANGSSEFTALNAAINSGSTSTDAGLIASPWLAQRAGYWSAAAFGGQGTMGYYWTSTQTLPSAAYAMLFYGTGVFPSTSTFKNTGYSVRCVVI